MSYIVLKTQTIMKGHVMQTYIGTKIIKAEPMNLGNYNKHRGWTIPPDEDPSREGYLVEYPDGYKSWSPKEVFDVAYREITDGERVLLSGVSGV